MTTRLKAGRVIETCLYARDLDTIAAFYETVLGLEVLSREAGRHVFFRCGQGVVLIFNPDHTSSEPTDVNGSPIPLHGAVGPGHVAFHADDRDCEQWRAQLTESGVAIESEVSWPNGGHSIYFRDPAGNSVELVTPEVWKSPTL